MSIARFNKTTFSAVVTALGIAITQTWPDLATAGQVAAWQGVILTLGVFWVPNAEA